MTKNVGKNSSNQHKKKLQKEQHKKMIIDSISRGEPLGKPTHQIVTETGLHRDTIHTLGKELMNHGLIQKQGKTGNYKLTSKVYDHPVFLAQRLAEEIIQKNSIHWPYISANNRFSCEEYKKKVDYFISESFKDKKIWGEMDSILIYEFANRIGAIITYLVIQALQFTKQSVEVGDDDNSYNTTTKSAVTKQKVRIRLPGSSIDKVVLDYISNAIRPHMILNTFIRFMNREKGLIYGSQDDILRRNKKLDPNNSESSSFYQIDDYDYERLRRAFAHVYSNISRDMESTKREKEEEEETTTSDKRWRKEIVRSDGSSMEISSIYDDMENTRTELPGKIVSSMKWAEEVWKKVQEKHKSSLNKGKRVKKHAPTPSNAVSK